MSKIKHIGASQLTGIIYSGTLDTEKSVWQSGKKDVTDVCCRAVAEHMRITKKPIAYGLRDGGFIILRLDVVDELPAEFVEVTE